MRAPQAPDHVSDSSTEPALAVMMREAPVVHDAAAAAARLSHALEKLAPAERESIEALFVAGPAARAAVLGIAEGSPFLLELIRSEPARLLRILGHGPCGHLDRLIDACAETCLAATDEAVVMRALRRGCAAKRRS